MIDRLSRQIAFFAPAAVMSAWATVMLHTIASGHINRLLSPMFRSHVWIAAIALLLLSALHLFLYQPTVGDAPITSPRSRLRQIGRWLVLLIPIVAASVLSPSALSSTTAALRSSDSTVGVTAMPRMSDASAENAKAALDADPNQPAPMEVTDLITVSRSPDLMKKFDGRQVRVVGLFAGGDPNKLMRWIMWCCAADAQPASVQMDGALGGPWKNEQWLEVTGAARFPSTLGHVVPRIEVESVKTTDEPDEPFLSP
jgi:putative membrane protein